MVSLDDYDNSKDIVFGLGAAVSTFRRNSLYRQLITEHWERYSELQAVRKDVYVRQEIIERIVALGGRFVQVANNQVFELHPVEDVAIIVRNLMQAMRDEKKQRKKQHHSSSSHAATPSPNGSSRHRRRSSNASINSNSSSRKRRNSTASLGSSVASTKKPRRSSISSSTRSNNNSNSKRKSPATRRLSTGSTTTAPTTTATRKKPAVVSAPRDDTSHRDNRNSTRNNSNNSNSNNNNNSPKPYYFYSKTEFLPPTPQDQKPRVRLPLHDMNVDQDVVFYYHGMNHTNDNRGLFRRIDQYYHEYRKTSRRSRFILVYCKIVHPMYKVHGGRFYVQHKDGWCTQLQPNVHDDLAEIVRRIQQAFAKEKETRRKLKNKKQEQQNGGPQPQQTSALVQQPQQQRSTPAASTPAATAVEQAAPVNGNKEKGNSETPPSDAKSPATNTDKHETNSSNNNSNTMGRSDATANHITVVPTNTHVQNPTTPQQQDEHKAAGPTTNQSSTDQAIVEIAAETKDDSRGKSPENTAENIATAEKNANDDIPPATVVSNDAEEKKMREPNDDNTNGSPITAP